jgi:hypothetical protein
MTIITEQQPNCHSPATEKKLLAAEGYFFFKMKVAVGEEFDSIEEIDKNKSSVLTRKLDILLCLRLWKNAAAVSAHAYALFTTHPRFIVQHAFALYHTGQKAKAKAVIASAPEWIVRTGVIHYNFACYEAMLGDARLAQKFLEIAYQYNSDFKAMSKMDPDLSTIWTVGKKPKKQTQPVP